VFLEEGATAGNGFQDALDPDPQKGFVGKFRARAAVSTGGGVAGEGLVEGFVHSENRMVSRH
jgi:hypothetical protein